MGATGVRTWYGREYRVGKAGGPQVRSIFKNHFMVNGCSSK
jgi:hypothetical protein